MGDVQFLQKTIIELARTKERGIPNVIRINTQYKHTECILPIFNCNMILAYMVTADDCYTLWYIIRLPFNAAYMQGNRLSITVEVVDQRSQIQAYQQCIADRRSQPG